MRIDIHPETEDDVQQIRGWTAMGMPTGSPMYRAVVLACTEWVDEHPDLMNLNPGSIIEYNGYLCVVQSDGKWYRLPGDRPGVVIDPQGVNWDGARIQWSAS